MADVQFAPFPLGIDMISEVTSLPEGAVVDAVDGVIVKGGAFVRRDGELAIGSSGTHSFYLAADGTLYCVQGAQLGVMADDGTFTSVFAMPDDNPVSFTELNDVIVFSSTSFLGRITATGIRTLGIDQPTGLTVAPLTSGGLDAGNYALAYSLVNDLGEESAVSPLVFSKIDAGGGFQLTLPTPSDNTIVSFRIYRTQANSHDLYRAADIPVIMTTFFLGVGQLGAVATLYMRRMWPGRFARYWQGRLLTARGRTLMVSEPMNYGLCDPRHGFVQFPHEIAFVEGIPSGVFVGTRDKTYFLDGSNPAEWQLRVVDMSAPLYGASALVPTGELDSIELPQGVDYVAVWLAADGFVLGLPQGAVLRPQASRIELDLYGQEGSLAVVGGVLTAIVH